MTNENFINRTNSVQTTLLSLDTSSTDTGWAVFKNAVLDDYGHISIKEKDSLLRQECMIVELKKKIMAVKPDICVVESPPFMNSPATLIMLAEIVGAVKGTCIDMSEYVEYKPQRWRKLIAMHDEKIPLNRADCKKWDMDKVRQYYDINTDNDNIADAILIGLARCREIENISEKM